MRTYLIQLVYTDQGTGESENEVVLIEATSIQMAAANSMKHNQIPAAGRLVAKYADDGTRVYA